MDKAKVKIINRKNRARRVRKNVGGTAERPRLCVRRSLNHIYAQIIDDSQGRSLVQVGSSAKEIAQKLSEGKRASKTEVAKMVGEAVAAMAMEKGISKVVFDRKGYPYHGRIKALADAARAKGLAF